MEREPLIVSVPSALDLVTAQVRRERRKEPKPKPCLPWDKVVALLLLMSCASPASPPELRDAGVAAAVRPEPLPELPGSYQPPPCSRREREAFSFDGGRFSADLPLPCRPYDRELDLPDPAAAPR